MAALNPYRNLLQKVKAALKEDDNLTPNQCEIFQWQFLAKIGEHTFTVGKGGINTIFFSLASNQREVCYPEDILTRLENLSRGDIFCYRVLDRKKNLLCYTVDKAFAKEVEGAAFVETVDFRGRKTPLAKKTDDLFGKKTWKLVGRSAAND